jgi:5'-methylthioadenosine phosphorylase
MLGIIGGSGLYHIPELKSAKWIEIKSTFGNTSDKFLIGKMNNQEVVFLPRHGRGHRLSPTDINYRANIDALKKIGVTEIISVSAVGSLTEKFSPGNFVLVDQFIDRTFAREKSFFGKGLVAHVSMANPICNRLNTLIKKSAFEASIPLEDNGVYLVMEGPQFSTKAESNLYRSWGCNLIGMTNMPEAKLAREAEMCYSTIAMVTDFDCWHPNHTNVTVETIINQIKNNTEKVKKLLVSVINENYDKSSFTLNCTCPNSLEGAIITDPKEWDVEKVKSCKFIAGRVLNKAKFN